MLCWSAVFCKQPLHRPEEGCLVCFELSVLRRILFHCYWKGSSETIQESGAEANYLYKIKQPYDAVLNHLKRHPLFGICCGLCPTYSLSKCALVLRCGIWVWGPAMLWRINPFPWVFGTEAGKMRIHNNGCSPLNLSYSSSLLPMLN